jgi:FkbM family methyltransferase
MGDGPFLVRRGSACAKLAGDHVVTGIREIWVRDSYLGGSFLSIGPGALVVDLGANMGNFTLLALAQHHNTRVVALEASSAMVERLSRALDGNGWTNRVSICRAFIGGNTHTQQNSAQSLAYADATWISEDDFIDRYLPGVQTIDFLKCDIEGSEFALLQPGSRLLRMTKQLAVETHGVAGDCAAFGRMLEAEGFDVRTHIAQANCITYHAKKKDLATRIDR